MAKPLMFLNSAMDRLISLCFFLSAVSMVLLVIIGAGDAFGAAVFGQGIPAAPELSAALLAALVATSLPYAQARSEHIVVDILISAVGNTVKCWLERIALVVSFVIFVLVAVVMVNGAIESLAAGEFASAVYAFPIYPFKIIFAFGMVMLALETLRQGIRAIAARPSSSATKA